MSVYKRGAKNVFYMNFTINGQRVFKSTGKFTKKEAKQIEANERQKLLNEEKMTPQERTARTLLSDAIAQVLESRWKNNKDAHGSHIRALKIVEVMGDIQIGSIDQEWLEEYVRILDSRKITVGTVNRYLAILKTILRFKRQQYDFIRLRKERKGRIRVISRDEEQQLIQVLRYDNYRRRKADFPQMADLVETLIDTGMRLGEVRNIRYEDINFETGLISIWINKGDRPRSIPMTKRVRAILERRKEKNVAKPFTLSEWQCENSWRYARNAVGLAGEKEFVLHACIPTDLKQYFNTPEIKHSLKTKDSKNAKVMAVSLEYRLQQTFCMLRSGMLPDDMVRQVVEEILPSRQKAAVVRGKVLSEIVKQYVAEKESGWTYKTKLEVIGCLRLVVDVVGSVELKEITKQTVLDFRTKLMKLPANMYKIYPGKTIQAILDMADVEPMSINSVNKHIMRLNALLSYAVTEGIVTVNYAQGMMLADKRRNDEIRKVYEIEDLQAIVNNLPREQSRPERFWIPMIAMYAGMRLDEICQLYVEDVQQLDGVWCFNVNDEKDKKVKSASSKRVIPIHPVLLSCGFLEYVDVIKAHGDPRLWMNLSWRKEDGYGNAIGNWYRRFNREHVSKDEGKVFHSFRHTVTNTLKQIGISETVISELVGHSTSGSMTMGRYGKRYQPKVLLDALVQLDYGVDIPAWKV